MSQALGLGSRNGQDRQGPCRYGVYILVEETNRQVNTLADKVM